MNVSMKRGREEDATPAMASPRSPQMLDDPREDHGSNAVVGEPLAISCSLMSMETKIDFTLNSEHS